MKAETNPLSGPDPLLSINKLAEYLGVPVKTIYEWRQTGRGSVGIRMGRHACVGDARRRCAGDRDRIQLGVSLLPWAD